MIVESFVLILWRSNFQPAFSMGVAPIIADRFPRDSFSFVIRSSRSSMALKGVSLSNGEA